MLTINKNMNAFKNLIKLFIINNIIEEICKKLPKLLVRPKFNFDQILGTINIQDNERAFELQFSNDSQGDHLNLMS